MMAETNPFARYVESDSNPFSKYADPSQVPIGTTQGAQEDVGRGGALLEGYLSGASANFRDEVYGLSEASGLPKAIGGFRAPVGAAKVIWEYLNNNPGEATAIYERATNAVRERQRAAKEQYPGTSAVGEAIGAVASTLLPVGQMAQAATLPGRMAQGAKIGAIYGGVSGLGEGETDQDRITKGVAGAVMGGAVGGVAAPVVEGVIQGGRVVAAPVINTIRGIRDPAGEAARRIGSAIERDIATDQNAVSRLTPQEFAGNVQQGGPATIMDIGGETTRALARSAANTSPEGRGILNQALDDRFEGQGGRITDWMRQTFHFPNALAQKDALEKAATAANRPAYAKAYKEGDGVKIPLWNDDLKELAQAPEIQTAIRIATPQLRNWAVKDGFAPPRGAFEIVNGRTVLKKTESGNEIYPSLQLWDYVKRSLDQMGTPTSKAFARSLRTQLDELVPSYQSARSGAALFFGAENALEAGQNYVMQNFANGATRQTLARMSPVERQLFQDGFVSRFVETLDRVGDRRNILNQVASNPAAREKLEIALGRQRAAELEANLRVEGIMDLARTAVQGNSTTTRQLVELGLAGGVGGVGYLTSDPSAIMNAALMWGAARGHRAIDARVAARVAEMLTSQDPRMLLLGIQMIARNNNFMNALRTTDLALARVGVSQTPSPVLQLPGIGRTEDNQQPIPGIPAQ